MTPALLDINDSNLQLWHGDLHLQSPGYALLRGGQYVYGIDARAAARLEPRNINTRYWWQLNTEALQPAFGPARHSADLVHGHLQALHREAGEPAEIILAVSGCLQHEQLSLLLGIVQACPFAAVGLVNRSVALASPVAGQGRLFHLEIQLHQGAIIELAADGDTVTTQRTVPLPGCGLLQLQERLVETIAAAFIRQTRFDPRRKAGTEQSLYDRLPGALRDLQQRGETSIEVNGNRASINRRDLVAAGQRLFTSAHEAMGVSQPDDRILLDPVAALLPGISEQLGNTEVLAAGALPAAVSGHLDRLVQRGDALNFISTLPCTNQRIEPDAGALELAQPTPRSEPSPGPAPTHLLRSATATGLQPAGTELGAGYSLYRDGDAWRVAGGNLAELTINGSAYAGQALGTGDEIALPDGDTLRLIEVVA